MMGLDLEIWTKILMSQEKTDHWNFYLTSWRRSSGVWQNIYRLWKNNRTQYFVQYLFQKIRNYTSINKIRHLLWAVIQEFENCLAKQVSAKRGQIFFASHVKKNFKAQNSPCRLLKEMSDCFTKTSAIAKLYWSLKVLVVADFAGRFRSIFPTTPFKQPYLMTTPSEVELARLQFLKENDAIHFNGINFITD